MRTVVVTGGNTGIGKETARALARRGDDVIIACRNPDKGLRAADDIRIDTGRAVAVMPLDLASTRSIRAFAARLLDERERLDVLVLNAGIFLSERRVTEDGFEEMFGVNHLGHFLLTHLVARRLVASSPSRVVVVASRAHRRAKHGLDFDDLMSTRGFDPMVVYGKSKLANILFTRELARRLGPSGVVAHSLHPGVVATEFAGRDDANDRTHLFFTLARPFLRTPEEGASTVIHLAVSDAPMRQNGLYFADEQPVHPSRFAEDDDVAGRLWSTSEALLGIR